MVKSIESHETSSQSETEALGAEIADRLAPGTVVYIRGDLGAGKTALVRGACRQLGGAGRITSPTFTIAHRYDDGIHPISHLDLYRLGSHLDSEVPGLLEEELGPERITFVEWPGDLDENSAVAVLNISIEHRGGDKRLVKLW